MTNKMLFILLAILLPALSLAQSGKVIIKIEGIDASNGGNISVGIFTKPNFPKVGKALFGRDQAVGNASSMQLEFKDVPVGSYAFVAFHDIDGNQKLKSNLVGYPTEPIGFSRDAKMRLGPPAFSDAKMDVKANQTLIVRLKLK
ncbi:MAG: DUF2141 domain-containing protein [Bacteroidia bacterium]|nr:DUF2141 domain-containing protein [Bacteroidia bacterium]